MSSSDFTITFRGVRGGYPTPGPSTLKYGGNTTCIEVRVGGHLIIVDAGTGIIPLGRELMHEKQSHNTAIHCIMLITHLHHDHTQGFPFFAPIFDPEAILYIYGLKPSKATTLKTEMHRIVQPPGSPLRMQQLRSHRYFKHIRGGEVLVLKNPLDEPVVISPRLVDQDLMYGKSTDEIGQDCVTIAVHYCRNHPQDGVLVYRINYKGKSAVIGTDTEGFIGGDRELIKFSKGADFLSHDAEYDDSEYGDEEQVRQGWGHSTWRMAIEVAQAAGAKKLALFHHNSNHDDIFLDGIEKKAQAIFPEAFVAREGMTISL
jgi:phosphoribosyl 1,2-cyclic phosphodiesterase